MTSNRLKLNDDKTHLLVMITSNMRINRSIDDVCITTTTEIIRPTSCETLLGNVIHEGLKWKSKLTCKVASFKTRLMIANGIFMSKLIYVIPLWAGCENYLINALQIIQNSAARAVTKCNWRTPIQSLLSLNVDG